jgi:hypothetical protein
MAREDTGDKLAYSVQELRAVTGLGRQAAYDLARQIGIRVGKRRLIVPTVRLQRWLETGEGGPA